MSAAGQETDSLAALEDRIQQAVELVSRLRAEKEGAVKEAAEARAEAARVSGQLEALQAERKQVRQRIEKLLGQIDQLGTS